MALSLTENATRAHARTALIPAGLVLVVTLAQNIVRTALSFTSNVVYGGYGYNPVLDLLSATVITLLPFAVGVFLAFWLLVPLPGELGWAKVLVRSLIATAAGAVVVLVSTAVSGIAAAVASAGPLFGASFPAVNVGDGFAGFVSWIQGAVLNFIELAPLVALAAILAWLWLGKRNAA